MSDAGPDAPEIAGPDLAPPERARRYRRKLLFLLSSATFFDGYTSG